MERTPLLALALLCCATPALAGDPEAIAKYNEALSHWKDPDPAQALVAAKAALEEAESKAIRLNALLLLGRLHSAKTGDSKQALVYYDQIIEAVTISDRDSSYWGLKASALVSKANIFIGEKSDYDGGLKALNASYDLLPTAANTNVLSQLILRLSQEQGKEQARVRGDLLRALNYAKEAVSYEKNSKRVRPNVVAKYRVQVVLVLAVLQQFEKDPAAKEKHKVEAAKIWQQIDHEVLDENASYELAQLAAVKGEDAKAVGEHLQTAMDQRPVPRARNLLRKWIREEPFFQRLLKEPTWKGFVTNEPDPSAESPQPDPQ